MKHIFKLLLLPLLIFTTLMAEPIKTGNFSISSTYTKNFNITNSHVLNWHYSHHWHYLRADAGADKETKVGRSVHIVGSAHGVHYLHQRYVRYTWILNNQVIARTAAFDYTPSRTGVDTLTLKVNYWCYVAYDRMKITVHPAIKPLQVDAGEKRTTQLGTNITISGSAKNGTPPYTYKWTSNGQILAHTRRFEYQATTQGVHPLRLTVRDSAGIMATDTTSVKVIGRPLVVDAGQDKTVTEGTIVTITGNATGGTKPYKYVWSLNKMFVANTKSFDYNASHSGHYTFTLDVTDQKGITKRDTMSLNVKASTLIVDAGENKDTTKGSIVTITGNATGGTKPYSYVWSLNKMIVAHTKSFDYNASTKGQKRFILTVTDHRGIHKTDDMILTVSSAPIKLKAYAGKDRNITVGRSINLYGTATGGSFPYQYKWTLNGNPVDNQAIHMFTPTHVGKYIFTFIVSDRNQKQATDTVVINVNEVLSIDAGKDINTFVGRPVTLKVIVKGGVKPYRYIWRENGVIRGTNASYTYTPTIAGRTTFSVQVTDAINQSRLDSIVVTAQAKEKLIVDAGKNQYTTVNKAVILSATVTGGTQPYRYNWTIEGQSIGHDKIIKYTPTTIGTKAVTLTVTDKNGKQADDLVDIYVKDIPLPLKVQASASKTNITVGGTTTLTVNVEGGTKPYTYRWTLNGDILGTAKTLDYNAIVAGKQIFILKVTDANQESNESTITVNVSDKPLPLKVQASASKTNITVGGTTTLTVNVEGGTKPYTYRWTLNGDILGTAKTLDYNAIVAGKQIFILKVTDANQESNESTITVNVSDKPLPLKVLIKIDKSNLRLGETAHFTSVVKGGTKPYIYKWILRGDTEIKSTEATLDYTSRTIGTKTFILTVIDANQKTGLDGQIIVIGDAP